MKLTTFIKIGIGVGVGYSFGKLASAITERTGLLLVDLVFEKLENKLVNVVDVLEDKIDEKEIELENKE